MLQSSESFHISFRQSELKWHRENWKLTTFVQCVPWEASFPFGLQEKDCVYKKSKSTMDAWPFSAASSDWLDPGFGSSWSEPGFSPTEVWKRCPWLPFTLYNRLSASVSEGKFCTLLSIFMFYIFTAETWTHSVAPQQSQSCADVLRTSFDQENNVSDQIFWSLLL